MDTYDSVEKRIFIKGEIILLGGLHIGGTDNNLEIGGVNNPIIRIKKGKTSQPYIPGSSLKGKMRSLIEHLRGEFHLDKKGDLIAAQNNNHITARIFGAAADEDREEAGNAKRPSRIIFRDGFLASTPEMFDPTEIKTENAISRITAHANPRPLERVLPETVFDLELVLNIFQSDLNAKPDDKKFDEFECDAQRILGYAFIGMELIEEDYLGGSGSRGSGKVAFNISEIKQRTAQDYQKLAPAKLIDPKGSLRPRTMEEFKVLAASLGLNPREKAKEETDPDPDIQEEAHDEA